MRETQHLKLSIPDATDVFDEQKFIAEPFEKIDSQLAQTEQDIDEIVVLISRYPRLAPETNDAPRIQRGIDDIASKGGGVLKLPSHYICNSSLVIKPNVALVGQKRSKSKITFVGCSGIITGDVRSDGWRVSDLLIECTGDVTNKIGIHSTRYSGYYTLFNLDIRGFGSWGVKLEGGIACSLTDIEYRDNGNSTTNDEESGSLFVTVANNDNAAVSVLCHIDYNYARSGGKYGLRLNRQSDITVNHFISEYHWKALYVTGGTGTITNFYQEANRSTDNDVIHLHDTSVLMIGGRRTEEDISGGKVLYTWSGVAVPDRMTTKIGYRDIQTRIMEVSQINFTSQNPSKPKNGSSLRLINQNFEIYQNNQWNRLDGVHTHSAPRNANVDYNLGTVNMASNFTIEITNCGEGNATRRAYRKLFVMTGNSGNILGWDVVSNIGTYVGEEPTLFIDGNNNLILRVKTYDLATNLLSVKLTNMQGLRYITKL